MAAFRIRDGASTGRGHRANSVHPATVEGEMIKRLECAPASEDPANAHRFFQSRIPSGRSVTPEEIVATHCVPGPSCKCDDHRSTIPIDGGSMWSYAHDMDRSVFTVATRRSRLDDPQVITGVFYFPKACPSFGRWKRSHHQPWIKHLIGRFKGPPGGRRSIRSRILSWAR
jgi:hypothetical protein